MKTKIKTTLFNLGGYLFWLAVALLAIISLMLKGCKTTCYDEVVNTVPSPNGEQIAEITLGDCGGATTDFFGSVNVKSENPKLQADAIFGFAGHPTETGLELRWLNDTELVISISDLYKARHINPNGRKSASLKVSYEYRQND